jgi:ABC-2 type transport system ATP-binding protein
LSPSERVSPPVTELPTGAHTGEPATGAVELPRLELAGVSKRWRRNEPPLLDGLDLTLHRGTQTLVVGQNGVGKTTLLRIASGMIAADSGVVRVDGLAADTERMEYQRRVGFLSAGSTGLYARLTVARHLDLWARLALVPARSRRSRIAAALERFDLHGIGSRRADRLSMGQRQRLRLALAFLHRPSVVLLDEPWNSLDESGIQLVNTAVDEFVGDGGSALLCEPTGHDLALARADRIYTLEAGKLVAA